MTDNTEGINTVVIGAGISGLCAARRLQRAGENVLVLEARDRVGGRTYTVQDRNHGAVDLGGAYVGPTQNRVYRLAKELGLELYRVNDKDNTVMDLKGCLGNFKGVIPPFWNPFKILDLNNFIRTFDLMANQVPLDLPTNAAEAKKWDSITVAQFADSILWTRSVREVVDIFIRTLFCVEASEISLLFALWYIRSGGGIARVTNVSNGAQESKFYGGSQQLSEGLTRQLGDDVVQLSSSVVHIKHDENKAVVTDTNGKVYKAKSVIIAVPLPLINRIEFDPPLPFERIQLIQRAPMGSIIKTIMFYKTSFWKQLEMSGSAASSQGICSFCLDDTKPDDQHPAIVGFIVADRAREIAQATVEVRKQALCAHYAKVFRCDEFLHPIGYLEHNWMADQYSGGCYSIVMPPNVISQFARYLKEPIGNVYFAGTETATCWAGYMEGAIQAGERAANQVLYKLGKIRKHEIDVDEPESVDHPAIPVPFSYLEYLLPSNSALLKYCALAAAGFFSVSFYYFMFSWEGALFWRWFKWYYDVDSYVLTRLMKRVSYIPTRP